VRDNFTYSLNFIYCSKVGPNKGGSVKVLNHDNIRGLLEVKILTYTSTLSVLLLLTNWLKNHLVAIT